MRIFKKANNVIILTDNVKMYFVPVPMNLPPFLDDQFSTNFKVNEGLVLKIGVRDKPFSLHMETHEIEMLNKDQPEVELIMNCMVGATVHGEL